ncbi:MAG: hypothetical protein R3359_00140 [Marinirhabdus sp.]|nr:hypothetical protein [Marinirhabdus sp.]
MVIVVIGISQLDRVFYKDGLFRDTLNNFEASSKDYDLVFIGNSHSHSSFDPRVFELELGAKTINLAAPAQSLVTTRAVASMLLKETKPDLVVLNIFSTSLNETNNEAYKAFQLATLDFLPHSVAKSRTIFEMFPFEEWPAAFSETIRYHHNWDTISSFNKPYNYNLRYDVYKGFATYKTTYDSVMLKKFQHRFEKRDAVIKSLSAKQKKRIDAIIALFEKHQVPVLFINAPSRAYQLSTKFRTYAERIQEYLEENDQTMLDLNRITDTLGLVKKHYRDPNHLNTRGALVVSEYLANYLKSNYEIGKSISKEELGKNRYYLMDQGFPNSIHSKNHTKDSVLFNLGFRNTHLYYTDRNRFELAIEVDKDAFNSTRMVLQYGFRDNKLDEKKFKTWITLDPEDVLTYSNRHFAIVTLFPAEKKLYDLELRVLGTSNQVVLTHDSLKL